MSDKPNIIVFFTDQQRWDSTGVHGNPLDLTPNFDRMARAGTHLHTTVTCQPVCGPARSCLQTGMYATNTGSWRNGIPLRQDLQTMAHFFKAGGYDTGYIGKWHLAENKYDGAVPPEQRGGYDYWLASNLLEFTSDAYDMVMYDNDQQRVKLPGYRVDAQTDAVIRYIDSHQENPFFLFISYIEPHHQNHLDDYPPPDGYRERYAGRWTPPDLAALGGSSQQHLGGYWGMIKRLDEALGRMTDSLKSLEMLDNTIILYTTDHGCHFKTRNSEYKRSCHEASVRLPTALIGPGFTGGGEIREMISLVDLPPTLLDAAGLPIPAQMEGRSVLPLVNREAVDWPEEAFIQISESQVGRAVRTKRWKYGVTAPDKQGSQDAGSDEYVEQYLYDLEYDPYELTNLIGWESHRRTSDVLKERLIRRMVQAGESAPLIHNAPEIPKGQRKVSEAEAFS
ncbi:MAG: sulfatase-like hydrolase/transferase [Caldilineaceae bacterium]